MSDRIWNGGTGDFYTASQWTTDVAPVAGDESDIYAGLVTFSRGEGKLGGTYNTDILFLGSTSANAPAQITSNSAFFGENFVLDTSDLKPQNNNYYVYADFLSIGTTGFAGTLTDEGATFALSTEAVANVPGGGDFVLENGGAIMVEEATLATSGRIDLEGNFTLGVQSVLVNTGTINVEADTTPTLGTGQESEITGGGTIVVALGAVASILGSVGSQTFTFQGPGGVIALGSPTNFQGTITNYATGDIIDLAGITATTASYNATTSTLTAFDNNTKVASLHVTGPTSSGTLSVASDGAGGTGIEEPHSAELSTYLITGADDAMGSNIVRATLTTHAGTPITGAGIKVGVISGSFNNMGGANADAAAGFLPANADGTSAVDVLSDYPVSGNAYPDDDEGRAMAEEVHQVAPGAQLYFAAGYSDTSLATAVNQLVAAGVNIIVDDISVQDEPFFQITGSIDTSIQAAMADGISYFTSASNYGSQYYQANFTKTATTDLTGAPSGTNYAQTFSNGSNYQLISVSQTTDIDLQWDAPFPTTASGTSPLGMELVLLDTSGDVIAHSTQTTDGITASEPEVQLSGVAPGRYELAIYQTAAEAAAVTVNSFKYIMFGNGNEAIADNAASDGSGAEHGHELIPGVNTVAASDYANSPAFTGAELTEEYSSSGPGELLFDSNGNRLTTPDTNDAKPQFAAPDGVFASPDLTGFQPFYGTSGAAPDAAAVAALMMQANTNLETNPTQVTTDLENSALNLGEAASEQGAGLVQAVGAVDLALQAACYATGTRLRTMRGEVAVENLLVGDIMVTAQGAQRPVRWIGHRQVDCGRHPKPETVWPVRIAARAFAPEAPSRALVLSPDHAVFVEDVLIPVKVLINGTTIVQVPQDAVTYWHVELDSHDVIMAEALPCESYLDTGNRSAFANGGAAVQLHPEFAVEIGEAMWETAGCAPLRIAGEAVVRATASLRQRAAELGYEARVARPKRIVEHEATADLAALLQPGRYLSAYPDVAAAGLGAAAHYSGYGRAEGRLPCGAIDLVRGLGLVDPGTIAFTMTDVAAAGADPVEHFCQSGWRERRRPNPYFDTGWYLDAHDVPVGMNPLLHYLLFGEPMDHRPCRHFDTAWYRQHYSLEPTVSPLAHYLLNRHQQRFSPLESFDVLAYRSAHSATLRPGRDPYAHFLADAHVSGSPKRLGRTIS